MPFTSALAKFAGRLVPIEKITDGVVITNSNHSQIHVGRAYSVFYRTGVVASSETEVDLVLTLPAGVYLHFQVATLSGNGAANLDIFENSTLTPGADIMTPVNRNRISTKTSVCTFKSAAVTLDGTHLDGDSLFGTSPSNAKASAGRASDENEWVFDNDGKDYHFRITTGINNFEGVFKAFWYEEGAGYAG